MSTKLMPASSALWMIRTDSSWSGFPMAPNIIAPRQYGLTLMPVRPSVRYFMKLLALWLTPGAGTKLKNGTTFSTDNTEHCSV